LAVRPLFRRLITILYIKSCKVARNDEASVTLINWLRVHSSVAMPLIRAVTFDLWDTLIQEAPRGADRVAAIRIDDIGRILEAVGQRHPRAGLERAYSMTGDHLEAIWRRYEDVSAREQVEFLLECLDAGLPDELTPAVLDDIESVYSNSMLRHRPRLLPGAAEALSAVRDTGVVMGLISNTGKTPGSVLRVMLEQMGILGCFSVSTFSNEVRERKPAQKIFEVTLAGLGVDARDSVHIGDNPVADIEGAKGVGMRAILVGQDIGPGGRHADVCVPDISGVARALESLSE
jgi:putative hydrolase of the HAD superfamily